jgi:transposase
MVPYPTELRTRVVAAVEQGDLPIAEIAPLFGVGMTFIKKMLRLHRAGEDLAPRHGGGPAPKLQDQDRALLRAEIAKQPDATLAELQTVVAEYGSSRVRVSTICRALSQLKLPRKKSLRAQERDEGQREQFRQQVRGFDPRSFICLDERGCNLALTRRYGRAAPGARVRDAVPSARGGNGSTIGALDLTGFRTGLSVPGAIEGETMVFFIEELLAPTLQRGDLVFMDNCPIHKMEEIEDVIDACGAGVLFLPPYSPDLNPIEHGWSKVKTRLRALKPRTREDVLTALVDAFATVTPQDMRGWFRHCGYQVAPT